MVRGKTHHPTSVRDLINRGIVRVGDPVTFEPRRGELYTGKVESNGDISLNGRMWDSLSAAATTLAGNSRNGWAEIKCNGVPFSKLREQLEGRTGSSPVPPRQHQPPPSSIEAVDSATSTDNTNHQVMPRSATEGMVSEVRPSSYGSQTPLREELLNKLRAMGDKDFEEFVGRVLVKLGFEDVSVVGRSGDGGIDIECTHPLPLIDPPISVACQVKKHSNPVGPNVVGDLRGRWAHRHDRLLLVNLGGFTAGAKETANEDGAKPVKLMSGSELVEIMAKEEIGVTRTPVVQETLDETFFTPFSS